ncbi:hypothetical protein CTAYLR_008652 [Chrysophaeum taylorii]|uniref:SH3 domain-containing protein n=1 Tax=Chrysophaeum taylorii TaxID=2483200 RepID=A0AAD7XJU8_9STRA|nr:hypothetical protein CTAYLR_008652 [Chrysophaeum taylorii]
MTCRVLWDYSAAEADELSLRRGETVVVERKDDGGWWFGHVASNPKRSGLFPGCYVRNQEEEDPATVPEPKNEPIERTMMNSRKATKLASSVTQDDDDDGACRSSETRDDILETMLELEARTAAAEASLAEERRVADAFRAAAMGSLELLENILSRILKPLPGIVLETPDDDGYSEDDVRVLQHGETSNTLGEQLALLVANQMGSKVKQINSCQRGVSWADFCDSLEACFEKELAARQFGSKDNVLAAHATTVAAQISHVPSREDFVDARGPKTELPPRAARLRPRVGPAAAIGNEYQSNGVEIKSRRSRADTEVFVSPADFLRLCRDYDICTTLLSRQEATTICRLSLTMAKKCDRERTLAPAGLNEAQLHRTSIATFGDSS